MLAIQQLMNIRIGMKALILTMAFLATSCSHIGAQKGGSASVSHPSPKSFNGQISTPSGDSGPTATLTQPDNPNSSSKQDVNYEYEEETTLPYDTVKTTSTAYPDGRVVTVSEPIPAGTKLVKRSKSNVIQEVGGSWKDTARELSAALGSFRGVQYVGIALLLAGAVCFFHPVLRGIIGGKDTAMAIGGCGAVMMFGPYLFVKYSNYFFLAILGVGAYWLIARLKYKEGKLDHIESLPSANATTSP